MIVPYSCTITPDELIASMVMFGLICFAMGAGLVAFVYDWRRR